ncbi:MAG: Ku protein [Actinomycetota bacterium]|jgi:DNA end-binding protein Ku|nr:Ku protein [Actinomycetota bacterium]
MPRPLWKGTVSFGLVSVPVELYSAITDRGVHFREIHTSDGSPVKHVRYCAAEDKPVDQSEVGRAYELDDGRLIPVTDEELENLEPEKTQTIEIETFVTRTDVDPIRFDHPYYMVPGNRSVGTLRAYRLLVEAMTEGDLLAMGTFVMRSRGYLAAIRVRGDALALSTMHFPAEIRSISDLPGPADAKIAAAELDDMVAIVGELSADWDPDSYSDRYRARLKKVITSKKKGRKIKAPAEPEEAPTAAPDLMAALKETLASSRRRSRRPKDLEGLSRDDLYELASKRGLKGRSKMNKGQLIEALGD